MEIKKKFRTSEMQEGMSALLILENGERIFGEIKSFTRNAIILEVPEVESGEIQLIEKAYSFVNWFIKDVVLYDEDNNIITKNGLARHKVMNRQLNINDSVKIQLVEFPNYELKEIKGIVRKHNYEELVIVTVQEDKLGEPTATEIVLETDYYKDIVHFNLIILENLLEKNDYKTKEIAPLEERGFLKGWTVQEVLD